MDKNKIIEAAAKLVAKGAYDKAIKEYQKVLEADPKDGRVLQKMGELFQKKNDNVQAAFYFTKVAEGYSADGFFLKAVALYKQVLKLNPNLLDVNLKLAELHQQLGLMSEAMAYFQIVANHYDKAGDVKNSLDTLKKMVDLDPENVASKIKLAELYARENMAREAAQEFKKAAEYLKRNNRMDDWFRVAERLATLEPDNVALARDLAQQYLARGDQKRALARLQVCFKADGRDVETLSMLAQAFHGLGQTAKTISVYKELAKVYQERSRAQDARDIWDRIAELDPTDADLQAYQAEAPAASSAEPAFRPSRSMAAVSPAAAAPVSRPSRSMEAVVATPAAPSAPASPPPSTPSPAAPAATAAPAAAASSGKDQFSKLLTETEVYVKYGLHDKALDHLRKIFSVDPENLDAHEKAYQIYVASGNVAQAGEQLLNVLRLCTRRAEVQRAQPYLTTILQQNPGHPEVPAFLSVLQTDDAAPSANSSVESVAEDANSSTPTTMRSSWPTLPRMPSRSPWMTRWPSSPRATSTTRTRRSSPASSASPRTPMRRRAWCSRMSRRRTSPCSARKKSPRRPRSPTSARTPWTSPWMRRSRASRCRARRPTRTSQRASTRWNWSRPTPSRTRSPLPTWTTRARPRTRPRSAPTSSRSPNRSRSPFRSSWRPGPPSRRPRPSPRLRLRPPGPLPPPRSPPRPPPGPLLPPRSLLLPPRSPRRPWPPRLLRRPPGPLPWSRRPRKSPVARSATRPASSSTRASTKRRGKSSRR
ncbi:putative TPR domain protein [Cystobacter fuscus DSM 2262]|uniref:TPR domain protein n=1 Tax=Cystobacter fuscus (strain ATCC 25194 / DSM 2262 / NBRC 100088 / M29) TaxID=1242864 RepID=S9QPF5_CYSF2|nr:tetratricopeptide repeat protein [Cystobacter fuscus]EPX63179.1 putative TPR domain protein [Cystobacter fuscus DSM 2262]